MRGVGLAAPQIGDSRRILVADPSNNDDADAPTLFKMVNPKIINKSASLISYEESCLSVPEFYLNVKRFEELSSGMAGRHGSYTPRSFLWFSRYCFAT